MKISILVDNNAKAPFVEEHGLSLLVDICEKRLLFDTGAGEALSKNAQLQNIDLHSISDVVFSHGHNDHTGGLHLLSENCTIWASSDIAKERFSIHENPRNISMPKKSVECLHRFNWRKNDSFTEIFNGAFLTGTIPRISGEDTGGPFYLDCDGNIVDFIYDEQALLTSNGVLIQGCCHSGIINTLRHCKKKRPDIKINTIVGGLHLLNAKEDRLKQTANFLNQSDISRLIALHCTGANALEYFKQICPKIEVITASVGNVIEL